MMEDNMRKKKCIHTHTHTHTVCVCVCVCIYIWLGHFVVQQKLVQHCKWTIIKKNDYSWFQGNQNRINWHTQMWNVEMDERKLSAIDR